MGSFGTFLGEVPGLVAVVRVVEVVREVEVIRAVRVVEVIRVVYGYEEIWEVKGPNKNKDIGLRMTMPQAAGKNLAYFSKLEGINSNRCLTKQGHDQAGFDT